MTIVELFNQVKNTSGTLAKKQLLTDNMNDLIKDIFEMTYGDHKYFITKLDRRYRDDDFGILTIDEGWGDFKQVLHQCETRHITGNDARIALNNELDRFTLDDQVILYNILQHNLKIGVSAENFYSIIGTPADKYEVSLAINLQKAKGVDPIDGTYFASRKLDGVRCLFFVERHIDGGVTVNRPRSRQNKEFTTLDNLIPAVIDLASYIVAPGRYVFDGEACILDEDGDEHFDWIMKEINRKNHTIENPCYNVFDFVPEDVFYGRMQSNIFSTRLKYLGEMMNMYLLDGGDDDRIHLLFQERIKDQDDFDRWSKHVERGGWEGFMLRKDTYYKGGRSNDLIKVKKFQDAEYTVIGTTNSKVTYNEDGQKEFDACSALIIEHKGNKVSVGSGLSKEQRLRWFNHPDEIVGKTITVQYFEETQDKKTKQYSLRFPILKYVYENGRDI